MAWSSPREAEYIAGELSPNETKGTSEPEARTVTEPKGEAPGRACAAFIRPFAAAFTCDCLAAPS